MVGVSTSATMLIIMGDLSVIYGSIPNLYPLGRTQYQIHQYDSANLTPYSLPYHHANKAPHTHRNFTRIPSFNPQNEGFKWVLPDRCSSPQGFIQHELFQAFRAATQMPPKAFQSGFGGCDALALQKCTSKHLLLQQEPESWNMAVLQAQATKRGTSAQVHKNPCSHFLESTTDAK